MPTPTSAPRPCRVALYIRSHNLAAPSTIGQEIQLRRFLLDHPDWTPVAEYADYGGSGLRTQPGLRRAVADARFGGFDLLLIAAVDRLGRDLTNVAAVVADLDRAGVAIVTADGAINTRSTIGRFVLAVLTAHTECEAALREDHDRHQTRNHRGRRRTRRRLPGCG